MSKSTLFDKAKTELDQRDLSHLIAMLMEARDRSGWGESSQRAFDKLWRQMLDLATREGKK